MTCTAFLGAIFAYQFFFLSRACVCDMFSLDTVSFFDQWSTCITTPDAQRLFSKLVLFSTFH